MVTEWNDIKVGDVLIINKTGIKVTVEMKFRRTINCVWFEGGVLYRKKFRKWEISTPNGYRDYKLEKVLA
jgi:hypothetical protein